MHTTEKCTYAEHYTLKCVTMREISVLAMKMMHGMFYTFCNTWVVVKSNTVITKPCMKYYTTIFIIIIVTLPTYCMTYSKQKITEHILELP